MKLYHGTNLDIEKIDLLKCRPYKDFGTGFYLTEIEEQAAKMAKRVSRIYGRDSAHVLSHMICRSFLLYFFYERI